MLETSLLLIIFNTNVTVIVLAQAEFTQVSIIVLKNKHLNYIAYLFADAFDKIRSQQIEKLIVNYEQQRWQLKYCCFYISKTQNQLPVSV